MILSKWQSPAVSLQSGILICQRKLGKIQGNYNQEARRV